MTSAMQDTDGRQTEASRPPVYRLAISGASSVGKTTLAHALMSNRDFRSRIPTFIEEGARPLAMKLGYSSMDSMTNEALRDFQRQFFMWKVNAEGISGSYLVDRSFVDLAAVWLERDVPDEPLAIQNELVLPCHRLSQRYTLHIHLPLGVYPFAADGFRERASQLHARIAGRIVLLLTEWQLPFLTLRGTSLEERVAEVNAQLRSLGA